MATLTIRKVDDEIKEKLRVQAARNGRSMEAEVREILAAALESPVPEKGLGTWLHEQFMAAGFGDVELELPKREPWTPSVDLSE
jgi:plasmid stability protein